MHAASFLLTGCALQSGVVLGTDSWDRTVTIDQQTYLVTSSTELYGSNGKPIGFDQIPALSDPRVGFRSPEKAEVEFLARQGVTPPEIEALWVRLP